MVAIKRRELPAAFRLMSDNGLIMRAVQEPCIQDVARLSEYDLSANNLMQVCSSFVEAKRYPVHGRGMRDHIIWWAILRILHWKYGDDLVSDEVYRELDKYLFLHVNASWEADPPMRDLYWFGVGRSVREDGWEPDLRHYPGKHYWPPSEQNSTRSEWVDLKTTRLRRPKSKK